MQWSRQIRVAGRGLRTALRAASAMVSPPAAIGRPAAGPGVLRDVPGFGDNPGGLAMQAYVPPGLKMGAPLVVLLHGCGQDAADFAAETGWRALADRVGIALVLPVQSDANNRQRCFHWFRPADIARGRGEAASIRAMAADGVRRFDADPSRVFVVGLSAGGAMAAALLAAYPDVFAAGAVVAGLPVGAASGTASALARMAQAGPRTRPASAWADLARQLGPADYRGPWPRLSIWRGALDTVVDPANATLLVRQWCALLGLDGAEPDVDDDAQAHHLAWPDTAEPRVELWTVPSLGHAYPTEAQRFDGSSATDRIAAFFGLAEEQLASGPGMC